MKHPYLSITHILFILLTLLRLPSAQADSTFGVSANLQYFNYEEFSPTGTSLDTEKGFIPGIGFSLEQDRHSLELDIYDGNVDYDGQLQSGTPYKTITNETLYKFGYRYYLPFTTTPDENQYYLGINYQLWKRDIKGSGTISNLFETYTWWTAEAGVRSIVFEYNAAKLQLELGLIKTFNADITVDFVDLGFGKPVLNIANETGIQAALNYQDLFYESYTMNMGIKYIHSKFGRSDSATVSNGFNTITITEPDSESNHVSLYIELVRPF